MKELPMMDPAQSPMQPAPQPAPEVQSTIQIGKGENQIPVDLSTYKPGDKVTLTLVCEVAEAPEAPAVESAEQLPGLPPGEAGPEKEQVGQSVKIISATAEANQRPVSDMGENEVAGKIDQALNTDEIPRP